jgi:hypothetical protein
MIFNIKTEKEGERKYTTLGKVWNNIRYRVRQFIYLFSSKLVPIHLFQLASLPKTKSSTLGWSKNGKSIPKLFRKNSKRGSSPALLKITIRVRQHLHLLIRFHLVAFIQLHYPMRSTTTWKPTRDVCRRSDKENTCPLQMIHTISRPT